jgi:hypothetical protein
MSKWYQIEACPCVEYARYIVPNFASNTITVAGEGGVMTVISPGESLLESFAQKYPEHDADQGRQLRLVMPNSFHYMGVGSWKARYPNAQLFASKKAIKRLSKNGVSGVSELQRGIPNMAGRVFWAIPPGHRGGDAWLCMPAGGGWLWVTCDSFLHYPRMSNQPVARFIQRLMGAAPGLKLSRVIKYLLMSDRTAFKRWCTKFIAEHPPVILLPSHGEPLINDQLPEQLQALIDERL